MHSRKEGSISSIQFYAPSIVLILVWSISLVTGRVLALCAQDSLTPLFRSLKSSNASFGAYFISLAIPFAVTWMICKFHWTAAIYVLCFVEGVSFGFCCSAIMYVFKSAGMLLNVLLHFSGIVSMFLLIWIWIRYLQFRHVVKVRDVCVCSVLVFFIYVFDVSTIFPFCHRLMNLL